MLSSLLEYSKLAYSQYLQSMKLGGSEQQDMKGYNMSRIYNILYGNKIPRNPFRRKTLVATMVKNTSSIAGDILSKPMVKVVTMVTGFLSIPLV